MAHRLTRLQVIFLTAVFFIVFGVCKQLFNRWSSVRRVQFAEQMPEPAQEVPETVDTERIKKLRLKANQQIAVTGEKIKLKKKEGFDVSPALIILKNAKNAFDLSDFENALEYARESANIADAMKKTPAADVRPSKIYVVKRGDTLWDISKKQYNKGAKWYDVWKANREKIADFDKIYRGQKITIPDTTRPTRS